MSANTNKSLHSEHFDDAIVPLATPLLFKKAKSATIANSQKYAELLKQFGGAENIRPQAPDNNVELDIVMEQASEKDKDSSKTVNKKLKQGAVSENFVRYNLKGKGRGVRVRSKATRKKQRHASPTKQDQDVPTLLQNVFRFDSFRDGQEEAITNIINMNSTLLILPTGQGKSLVYQMAAIKMQGLVIVISPLLSLMKDQVEQLPECLKGAMLSTHQTHTERDAVLQSVRESNVNILFVSPERFTSEQFIKEAQEFPAISFVCIDECDCISEWSHNFRNSYLLLKQTLEQLQIKTILAVTATATKQTEQSICEYLNIEQVHVIRKPVQLSKMNITISKEAQRDLALVRLLKSQRFASCQSILIYCMFKADTDRIMSFLKANQVDSVEAYHAGLKPEKRQEIQELFQQNKIRIMVATVAFGLGINNMHVDAVIHYCMPRSVEQYVQEIGRAGRNQTSTSQCHLYLDEDDFLQLRSFSFSDSLDQPTIRKFVDYLFASQPVVQPAAKKRKLESVAGKSEVCISKQELEKMVDCKTEVIATLLTYLQLDGYVTVLPHGYQQVSVTVYKDKTEELASQYSVIKVLSETPSSSKSTFSMNINDLLQATQCSWDQVESQLNELKDAKRIKYSMSEESFRIQFTSNKPSDCAVLSKTLFEKMKQLEQSSVTKLDMFYSMCLGQCSQNSQTAFNKLVNDYFAQAAPTNVPVPACIKTKLQGKEEEQAMSDIIALVKRHDQITNGRSVARILHGLSSPCFSSFHWAKATTLWKQYQNVSFYSLVAYAVKAILLYKQGKC